MNFLLLPEDEIELIKFICSENKLQFIFKGKVISKIDEILDVIEDNIPDSAHTELFYYIFWMSELGEIQTYENALETINSYEIVQRKIFVESISNYKKLIDFSRTPVIRWHRCHWHNNGSLCPGLLQAMELPSSEHPKELNKIYNKIKRWMKKKSEKLNPFDFCSKSSIEPPNNLNIFWTWAHPKALKWVKNGGEIWPWNA